jgi:S1-C subfamily serine protease
LSQFRIVLIGALILVLSACSLTSLPSLSLKNETEPEATEANTAVDSPKEEIKEAQVIVQPRVVMAEPTPLSADLIAKADAEELLLINIYDRVNPSVVNIIVTVDDNQLDSNGLFPTQGQGSGFVYDTEGHIVTNNHVIADAQKLDVTFYDGTTVPAEIVGSDADSDLAVIKVDVPSETLRPIHWGDSDEIKVGQRAVAIGNPFGLDGTLTSGIISALKRSLPTENRFSIPEIIQTDAAINPGNSGGPLLNSHGEVIGVNTAIVPRRAGFGERSFLGVGFAVPSNLAKRVVPSLIENGVYQHPWIGFQGNTVTPEIAEAMNLSQSGGALVAQVLSDSPADKAGLRGGTRDFELENGFVTQIGGDVIIGIADEPVNTFEDLISYLSRRGELGQTVTLTIIRDGKEQQVEIVLEARPLTAEGLE